MSNVSVTNTFTAGTTAVAADVNTNFSDLVTWLNNRNGATTSWDGFSLASTAQMKLTKTSNQLVFGSSNTTTLSATAPSASRIVTIPDPGADASFVMTQGAQTIAGAKTFSDDAVFSGNLYTVNWTDYTATSTITGWSSYGSPKLINYKKIGKLVFVEAAISGTSNSTSTSFTLPYANGGGNEHVSAAQVRDNGTYKTASGYVSVGIGASTASVYTDWTGTGWTASGAKTVRCSFWYQTA